MRNATIENVGILGFGALFVMLIFPLLAIFLENNYALSRTFAFGYSFIFSALAAYLMFFRRYKTALKYKQKAFLIYTFSISALTLVFSAFYLIYKSFF